MNEMHIFKHLLNEFPNDNEIAEIAQRINKSFDETRQHVTEMFSNLQITQQGIIDNINTNNFTLFPDNRISIGNYGKNEEMSDYFLCHYKADLLCDYSIEEMAIVTGFGPSNAPTAGTLSMIFRTIELQKKTGIYTHIIIPDLGFMNVRTTDLQNIINTTEHFIRFIQALGFDFNNGIIRTHNSIDLYRTFTIATSSLTLTDFVSNKEATQDLYHSLKLQGNDYSTLIHNTLCASDILLPILKDKKKLVLVISGVEEFYFTSLAQIVIDSLKQKSGSMAGFVNHDPQICSIFGRLIEGLFPYVKMSKSIPESSISLGDNEKVIRNKIINCGKRNEFVLYPSLKIGQF